MPPDVKRILDEVAQRHGLTVDQMLYAGQSKRYAWPKHEAMWRLRADTKPNGKPRRSFPRIAQLTGVKDHTTVIHGIESFERRCREAGERPSGGI